MSEASFYANETIIWSDKGVDSSTIVGSYVNDAGDWVDLEEGTDFTVSTQLYSYDRETNAYAQISGSPAIGAQCYVQVQGAGSSAGVAADVQYVGPFTYCDQHDLSVYTAFAYKESLRQGSAVSFPLLYASVYRTVGGRADELAFGVDYALAGWYEVADGEYQLVSSQSTHTFASEGLYYARLTGKGSYGGDLYIPFEISADVTNSTYLGKTAVDLVWTDTAYTVSSLGVSLYELNPLTLGETAVAIGTDFEFAGWYLYDDVNGYEQYTLEDTCTFDAPGAYFLKFTGRGNRAGDVFYYQVFVNDSHDISLYACNHEQVLRTSGGVSLSDLKISLSRTTGVSGSEELPDSAYSFAGWFADAGMGAGEALAGNAQNGPNAAGSYYVRIAGAGDYKGTVDIPFAIADGTDIASYQGSAKEVVWKAGEAVAVADIDAAFMRTLDDGTVESLPAAAFSFAGWYADDGTTSLGTDPAKGPVAAGYYYAAFDGVREAGYAGSNRVGFTLNNTSDLSCYETRAGALWVTGNGSVSASDVKVEVSRPALEGETGVDGVYVLPSSNYRVVGISKYVETSGVDGDGAWSEEAASATGSGYYRARLAGEGVFAGAKTYAYFQAFDMLSLDNYTAMADSIQLFDGQVPSASSLNVTAFRLDSSSASGESLDSASYRVIGYYTAEGERLSAFPTKPGAYQAVLQGVSPYYGTCTADFSLIDMKDLGNWSAVSLGQAWADRSYADTAELLAALDVRVCPQEDDTLSNFLDEGCYAFSGWYRGNLDADGALAYVGLGSDELPVFNGASYYARLTGANGYTGDLYAPVEFAEANDIAQYCRTADGRLASYVTVQLDGYAMTLQKLGISFFRELENGQQLLEEGVDYSVAGWLDAQGDPLDAAPSQAGDYAVTITGQGDFAGTETYVNFAIVDPQNPDDPDPDNPDDPDGEQTDISDRASVALAQSSYAYDGAEKKPGVTVYLDDAELAPECYSVAYENNVKAGTAKVMVTGQGSYAGSVAATFSIAPARITAASLKTTSAKYDGKPHKPSVASAAAGALRLAASDYSVQFLRGGKPTTNFTSAGAVDVKIAGKGNFTGFVTRKYTISKAANPMQVSVKAKKVKLGGKRSLAKTKKLDGIFTFKVKPQGSVSYVKVSSGSSKYLSVDAKTGKVTVKKGAKKGTHRLKVNVRAAGTANYAASTKTVTVRIKVA